MPAIVGLNIPAAVGRAGILTGAGVRGVQWMTVADALNYLLSGPCRQIIPVSGAKFTISTTTRTLRYTIWPSYQATHRLWTIGMASASAGAAYPTTMVFTDPSAAAQTFPCAGTPDTGRLFHHLETITSRVDTVTAIAPTIAITGADGLVTSIACHEICRPDLTLDSNDRGTEILSLAGGAPIYDLTGYSLGALPEAIAEALTMRRTLHQWSVPSVNAVTFNTGSHVNLFSADPALLERFLYASETQVSATVYVYTRSDVTTAGEVLFTMTSGGTLTVTIAANDTGTWQTGTLAIDAEQLATTSGWRDGDVDYCAITGKRNSGAGLCYVDAISIAGRAG